MWNVALNFMYPEHLELRDAPDQRTAPPVGPIPINTQKQGLGGIPVMGG